MNTVKSTIRTLLTSSLLLATSASAFASVISTPENLEITSINGQAAAKTSQVELTQGSHLIELKYDGLFEANADDTDARITSGRLYLPLELDNSADYKIQVADINSEDDARAFVTNPTIYLVSSIGAKQKHSLLSQNELITKMFLDGKLR